MKILVLDNFDSFTYNLVDIIRKGNHNASCSVFRNNEIILDDCMSYDKILIGPGPGLPNSAGIVPQVIQKLGPCKDILGICLGHQGIAEAYGAQLFNLDSVLHGITNKIKVIDSAELLFKDLPAEFNAGHYHSWSVLPESVGDNLVVTAIDENGLIMGLRHSQFSVRGLQFHPESIMTEQGEKIIMNWINGQ
jgi:anthranilate synthase component 2